MFRTGNTQLQKILFGTDGVPFPRPVPEMSLAAVFCKWPYYPGLHPRSSSRKAHPGKKSTFHKTIPACAGAIGSISYHCHGTVQRQQIPGLLQCRPGWQGLYNNRNLNGPVLQCLGRENDLGKSLGRRPHEANFLKLDCSKIKTVFGWTPRYTVKQPLKKQ